AKRFFQPLMISCHEEGLLTQEPNVNAELRPIEKSFRLCVCNETMEEKQLIVKWEIRDRKASVLRAESCPLRAGPLSSVWLEKHDVPDIKLNDEYLSFHLYEGEYLVSEGTVIFSLPKFFHYADPKLSCRVEGDEILVISGAYAKGVEILNDNQDMVLSDNYFDMDAGEKRIKIISGEPKGLSLRSVYDIR
ncbi:glycoside hydrolase family 2 protein, partial [Treponema sp. OttesenSCG-928-L16]|nr:glycoside hydrolase family 2 protein [Treponema sp. OttesenSCG-928-L16]